MSPQGAARLALRRRDPSGLCISRGRFRPTPPFDFERSVAFIDAFTPAEGEQTIEDGVLTKALRQSGTTMVFRIRATGSVQEPRLACTLLSADPLTRAVRSAARDRIGSYLSVSDDLQPFYDLAHADPRLASRIDALYGLHHVRFLTPFESACWSVLAQRTPQAAARKAKRALVEAYGDRIEVDEVAHAAFPEPSDLESVTEDDLREITRNGKRARYLRAVIEAFADVDEDWLAGGDLEEVESWLRSIDGIGEWSASFVLFRGLGRVSKMPLTEPMLEAARAAYGKRYSDDRLRQIAEGYGAWAGYWALYLRTQP
jgi:DNA-3-methyladenine glycosylase II